MAKKKVAHETVDLELDVAKRIVHLLNGITHPQSARVTEYLADRFAQRVTQAPPIGAALSESEWNVVRKTSR